MYIHISKYNLLNLYHVIDIYECVCYLYKYIYIYILEIYISNIIQIEFGTEHLILDNQLLCLPLVSCSQPSFVACSSLGRAEASGSFFCLLGMSIVAFQLMFRILQLFHRLSIYT